MRTAVLCHCPALSPRGPGRGSVRTNMLRGEIV